MTRRVLIMGAAGRDFHNFNTVFRDDAGHGGRGVHRDADPVHQRPEVPAGARGLAATRTASRSTTSPSSTRLIRDARRRRRRVRVLRRLPRVRDAQGQRGAWRRARTSSSWGRTRRCSTRTSPSWRSARSAPGSGKSQTTRAIAGALKDAGKRVVAVRHPMPYGDLVAQRVQRYATLEDLDRYDTHDRGARGVRAAHHERARSSTPASTTATILAQAQAECDVLLWDGGNNDLPFYRPTVSIVVADPLRAGHELTYLPGETNLRDGRRDRRQQGGLRHRRAARGARRDDRARSNPTATVVRGEQPRHGGRAGRRSRASGSWWSRTARRSRTAR